jgi:hypothetical protein
LGGALEDAADVIGEFLIQPVIGIVTYTPVPLRNGELALIRRPTNGPWPQIYDMAHETILPAVFALLFLGYGLSYLMRAIPRFGYQRQRLRGNIVSAMILTYWAWPLGVGILALMDGLTQGIAPPPSNLSGVLVAQLGVMIGAVSTPGPNILAAVVGMIDVVALIGVFLLYLFRIFYLLIFMQLVFLITALYVAEIPYLEAISQTAFSVFVKLSYAPIFMAATLALTDTLFASATTIDLGIGLASDFIYGVASIVLPAIGIWQITGCDRRGRERRPRRDRRGESCHPRRENPVRNDTIQPGCSQLGRREDRVEDRCESRQQDRDGQISRRQGHTG